MNLKLYFVLFLTALAVLFIVQNMAAVEIRFLFWKLAMSRALMFTLLTLIGVVIGWLLRSHLLHRSIRRKAMTKE